MKFLLSIAALLAIPALLGAAELAPEISLLALRHDADIGQLESKKDAATFRAKEIYFGALNLEERAAMTESRMPAVAAIAKEKTAVRSGVLTNFYPFNLPKSLQSSRKAYLDMLDRIAVAAAPRQQRIDAEYLRALTSVEPRAANNPRLLAQIAAEKERIQASQPTAAAPAQTGDSKSKQD